MSVLRTVVSVVALLMATPTVARAEPAPGGGVDPARVTITSIGLDEPLIPLGVLPDGSMAVPTDFGAVGWFTGGGRPGGYGPTVIAGHVDSLTGPAVFARLGDVAVGDPVTVTDVEGGLRTYRVSDVVVVPKSEFPTVRVFGAVPTDTLRLVTCSGYFDSTTATYADNRVVFAEPV